MKVSFVSGETNNFKMVVVIFVQCTKTLLQLEREDNMQSCKHSNDINMLIFTFKIMCH